MRRLPMMTCALLGLAACNGFSSDDGGEPSALCGPPTWDGWTLIEEVEVPNTRGATGAARECQPPTEDWKQLEVTATLPPGVVLGDAGAVQVLVFEYDNGIADVFSDCVNLACESTADSDLRWKLSIPADRPDLDLYVTVSVDADGNGSSFDPCDLYGLSEDFSSTSDTIAVTLEQRPGSC